ncbi:MAG: hypothetical protein AAF685_17595 [Cyanobacteria bacterium P01_C01_bin.89]
MFVGTRVFLALISYLVVLQILRPLLDACPFGTCIFSRLPRITFVDPCAKPEGGQCNVSDTCYSYEYAPCQGH